MKSLIIAVAAAVLLGGVAVATLSGRDSGDQNIAQGAFPERIPHSIGLPESKLGVDNQVTTLSDDLKFPSITDRNFKNGDTGKDFFRDNGTMKERVVWYRRLPDQALQIKWRATIAEDGVTYVEDAAFYADGTRQRIGERKADGTYQIFTYFQGGKVENTHTILAADGSALLHRVQNELGKLLYFGEKTKQGIEEKSFADNGNPVKYSLRTTFSSHITEYYGDTGIPKQDVTTDSYKFTVTYWAKDGKITEKRVITFGGMQVTVYENGVAKYEQYWQRMNPFDAKKGAESVWQLYSVARLDADGKEHWKLWFRTGDHFAGKHIPQFTYESKDGLPTEASKLVEVRNYTDAGCLRMILTQDAQYGNELKRVEYPQDRGCSTVDLPIDLMKERPFKPFTDKIPDPEPHF